MCQPKEFEVKELPHEPFTSDVIWESILLKCNISDNENWHGNLLGVEYVSQFDMFGRCLDRYKGETMDDMLLPLMSTNLPTRHPLTASFVASLIHALARVTLTCNANTLPSRILLLFDAPLSTKFRLTS
jgi:hypothetical protein